jgi:hypothetical protein
MRKILSDNRGKRLLNLICHQRVNAAGTSSPETSATFREELAHYSGGCGLLRVDSIVLEAIDNVTGNLPLTVVERLKGRPLSVKFSAEMYTIS